MAMRTIRVRLTPTGPEPPRIRTETDRAIAPREADPPLILRLKTELLVREVVTRRLVLDGPAVRRRRAALGLSLRALARRIGISAPFLCDIERGHRQPSAAVRYRLLQALEGGWTSD